ncbi:MAG TPA: acyl-CoA dehydrogenase family protein [Jatrophihabitans sp.]|nr:acyl-CoA dehydrogenase family protein [Jatrophihabitans sp.]
MSTVQPAARLLEVLTAGSRDAEQAERRGRLSDEVVAELRRAGIFQMCVPQALGGAESPPVPVLETVETLARADGALGWAAMIAATSGCVAGHLDPSAAKVAYQPDGLVIGPFAPLGRAVEHPGGWLVSGRWPYASLCETASWIMSGTVLPDGERRLMFVPAEHYTILPTWSVLGLCATGSHDVELRDVLVSAEYSAPLSFDQPRQNGPLYVFPVFGLLAAGIASVALGIADGAVEHLSLLAAAKTPTYSVRRLSERPAVQHAVAESTARLRAARGLLVEAVDRAWTQACERRAVDLDERLDIRVAAVEATSAAVTVVSEMFRAGGGSSVYHRDSAQHRLRDVYTAAQHAMVSPSILEVAGRRRLGLRIDEAQI